MLAGRGAPPLTKEDVDMPGSTADLGTYPWTARTEGHLTRADKRALLAPLLRTHAVNAVGRLAMATHLNSGRRAVVEATALVPPPAAEDRARRQLPAVLLNHSYRTYTFGAALGALEDLDVDHELLFAAAMLHDIGLADPPRSADFTLASARAARDVAEAVGLSSAATDTLRTAITLHHSPGVALDHGPVAYLLSAGAGVDVLGLKSWQLPPALLQRAVTDRPRLGFKREFGRLWRSEAAAVPAGRARYLRRYGAFGAAIRLAPFPD